MSGNNSAKKKQQQKNKNKKQKQKNKNKKTKQKTTTTKKKPKKQKTYVSQSFKQFEKTNFQKMLKLIFYPGILKKNLFLVPTLQFY